MTIHNGVVVRIGVGNGIIFLFAKALVGLNSPNSNGLSLLIYDVVRYQAGLNAQTQSPHEELTTAV